jgi:hypothetical protein
VADQKYRATEQGKEHRKEQAKRYRERCKECRIDMKEPSNPDSDSLKPEADLPKPVRVGDTKEKSKKKSWCQRPGCYERFIPPPQSPHKKYCGPECYKAMRRVLVRESRWRKKLNLAPKKGRDGPTQAT